MRYALYFAPSASHPLWLVGTTWLGRDPENGSLLTPPLMPGFAADEIADLTAAPRRYGLHATIKPPFHLADGHTEEALFTRLAGFAASRSAVPLPPLHVAMLDDFIALQIEDACPPLHALADACVSEFDDFRAPPDAAEIARRQPGVLDEAARARLMRWGYPHVFAGFAFHMSLTQTVSTAQQSRLLPWLRSYFAAALAQPCHFDGLAVYVEDSPGTPFRLLRRFPFGQACAR